MILILILFLLGFLNIFFFLIIIKKKIMLDR